MKPAEIELDSDLRLVIATKDAVSVVHLSIGQARGLASKLIGFASAKEASAATTMQAGAQKKRVAASSVN